MNVKVFIDDAYDRNENYVVNNRYDIKDGQYGEWTIKNDSAVFVPKGSAVYVSEVINRIDTGEKFLKIYFIDAHGKKVNMILPRKELTEQGIMSLLGYGVQVIKQNAKALITSIINQEPNVPCISQLKKLGFSKYNSKTIFLGKNAIGAGIESKYDGRLEIDGSGDYKEWLNMVKTEVIGHIPMEFMLAVGCSGVLADYLKDKVQVENVIVNIVGESSTGKTTAGLFMVSCGAKPSFKGDSFVLNFSDTQNAIIAAMQSSYPVLIDEGSLCRYNPTSLLYSLAMGKEKNRLNKDMEISESSYFSTAITMTSEKSLLNLCDSNSGLLVRVLEIENVEWTKNAKSSDTIKKVIQNNYGWLVSKTAKVIMSSEGSENSAEILYMEWYQELVKRAKEKGIYNNLTERACKQYALIVTSLCIVENVINRDLNEEEWVDLNIDDVIEFIEFHSPVKELDNTDIGSRAFIFLMQYITNHYSQFKEANEDDTPPNCLGRIKKIREFTIKNGFLCSKRLYIADITLEKILQEGKFPDKKVILKRWKEDGILKCEKDRYISDVKITGNLTVKGYEINLPEMAVDNKNIVKGIM